jgi:hypothetical protein
VELEQVRREAIFPKFQGGIGPSIPVHARIVLAGRIFPLTVANKKRNISAFSGALSLRFETLLPGESLAKEARNPCTEVQVFHRQYREKEAKIEAKVAIHVTCLFCFTYISLIPRAVVLGD